jgi:DNA-binding MarR family transcriptional regulator
VTAAGGADVVNDREDTGERQAGAGPALFRLVRFWSRRWAPEVVEGLRHGAPATWTVPNLTVIEAVHGASATTEEVTVADVAHQLGVDRSVASRMISDAVRHGYLRRDTSIRDARRARLTLTRSAERFLAGMRRHQQRTFEELVAHWPAEDRGRFAEYLRRLAAEVVDTPGR